MKLLYLSIILHFLASCNQAEKSDPIVGRWEYERIEQLNGDPIDLKDSVFMVLHRQHLGLTFSFSSDKVFKVTQMRESGQEEFIAEQPYELPDSLKTLRLKNVGRPDDNFDIIGISDSLLRINVFKSPLGYLVFRRKK